MALGTKIQVLRGFRLLRFCCYCFVDGKSRIDPHDIHMVDSHDTHVAFPKQSTRRPQLN